MLRQVPFFKLLIPFVLGIVLAFSFASILSTITLLTILLACFGLVIISLSIAGKWHLRWVFGFSITLCLTLAGFAITKNHIGSTLIESETECTALVKLLEPPQNRTSSYRATAKVTMLKSNDVWTPIDEKVMLYFSSTDSLIEHETYGSVLAISVMFNPPPKPLNPHQFNYRHYLERQQIYQTAYVAPEKWVFVKNDPSRLKQLAYNLRNKLLNIYAKAGIEAENLAVLSALTMGYKDLLDQETRRVFAASGAMHILAVSGLHVGILFSTLSLFLFFLSRIKKGKIIKSAILIAFLWFYAFFTGLSPSVVRASLMFSLVVVGMSFSRSTNIYNTLSASAFVILMVNPMLLTNIGFQLSYFAVLSIVFFYPHIYKLAYIKNRLLNKIWVLIAVSLSAQIGTFPLSLFYFSQFPNYFLLTNLYAIPLAFIILYLAIALILFSPIPFIFHGLSWLLNNSLTALNFLTSLTESLPYSTSTALSITAPQLLALSLTIVLVAIYLESKRRLLLFLSLSSLILFFGLNINKHFTTINSNELTVFADRSATLIGYKHANRLMLLASNEHKDSITTKHSFALNGYLNYNRIKQSNIFSYSFDSVLKNDYQLNDFSITQNKLGFFIYAKGKTMLIPHSQNYPYAEKRNKLNIDIVLLNANSPKLDYLLAVVKPATLLVDQTVPYWEIENISKTAHREGLVLHVIDKQGAYTL